MPQTSRVERKGVLPQAVYLDYSQEWLASYGVQVADLGRVLLARNITTGDDQGQAEIQIRPLGAIRRCALHRQRYCRVVFTGSPYFNLRDLRQISRAYQSPANYLNFYSWVDNGQSPQLCHHVSPLHAIRRADSEIPARPVDEKDEAGARRLACGPGHRAHVRSAAAVKENIDLFMEAL